MSFSKERFISSVHCDEEIQNSCAVRMPCDAARLRVRCTVLNGIVLTHSDLIPGPRPQFLRHPPCVSADVACSIRAGSGTNSFQVCFQVLRPETTHTHDLTFCVVNTHPCVDRLMGIVSDLDYKATPEDEEKVCTTGCNAAMANTKFVQLMLLHRDHVPPGLPPRHPQGAPRQLHAPPNLAEYRTQAPPRIPCLYPCYHL
jgi:hypothetical protein